MEALFVVPTMISPSVNERLVPALGKMIERNIILTNYSAFRTAAIRKYSGVLKSIRSEGVIHEEKGGPPARRGDGVNPNKKPAGATEKGDFLEVQRERHTGKGSGGGDKGKISFEDELKKEAAKKVADELLNAAKNAPAGSKEGEMLGKRPGVIKPGEWEIPTGLFFYTTISLEPTYMIIPITLKKSVLHPWAGQEDTRLLRIGIKSVPYAVKGINDMVEMMRNIRSKSQVQRLFFRKWNWIQDHIPFSEERGIYKGRKKGDIRDVVFAPSSSYLSNPNVLKRMMSGRKPATWSTLTILSVNDFKEGELKDNLFLYRDLVEGGWGDMVIVNEPKESVYFCLQRINACYELPFTYLKQVMDLTNVLDYSEVSRWTTKPFSVTSVSSAFRGPHMESYIDKSDHTLGQILEIING